MKKSLRVALLVIVSAACGAIGYKILRAEVESSRIPGEVYSVPEFTDVTYHVIYDSPLDIREFHSDRNHDGVEDSWGVSIMEGTSTKLHYVLSDENYDNVPDRVKAKIGTGTTTIFLADEDYDTIFETTTVMLSDSSDPEKRHIYRDLDRDGRLDTMLKVTGQLGAYESGGSYIRIGDTWTRAARGHEKSRYKAIIATDAGEANVVFEDGEWRISDNSL